MCEPTKPERRSVGLLLDSLSQARQFRIVPKQVSLRLPTDLWNRAQRELGAVKDRPEYEGIPLSTSRVLIMAIARGTVCETTRCTATRSDRNLNSTQGNLSALVLLRTRREAWTRSFS
jgi:hypothetical protein